MFLSPKNAADYSCPNKEQPLLRFPGWSIGVQRRRDPQFIEGVCGLYCHKSWKQADRLKAQQLEFRVGRSRVRSVCGMFFLARETQDTTSSNGKPTIVKPPTPEPWIPQTYAYNQIHTITLLFGGTLQLSANMVALGVH